MKKTISLIIFSLALSHAVAQTFPQRENTRRLMSYNIHHGEGMDGKMDIERIGKLIIAVNPEVVGLQELDSVMHRSGNINILQLLSEQTGMYATFGYSILHDGGKYGNGVLTREKPLAVKKIALPGEKEARSALIVELEKYVIVNTHLSLTNDERLQSVKIITKAIETYNKPVFLMGDLNATPDSEPVTFLRNKWQILSNPKHPTSPSVKPRATIDYVLGYTANGQAYATHRAQVIDEQTASDHRPLFVDVRLKTPAPDTK
ncbi:MAG: endonuclease/exonuclease/phosphatase family protein [Proteiniphilum sp.]|jgi:endonuclease/exonuclease/phosphatase family metal-dependent hydrolase|nr:endonuclease/exonuclease/phosphatase family protein [Proteiniphilum sp.]